MACSITAVSVLSSLVRAPTSPQVGDKDIASSPRLLGLVLHPS